MQACLLEFTLENIIRKICSVAETQNTTQSHT